MEAIEKAKELGILLTKHPSYIKMKQTEKKLEEDLELTEMVNDYLYKIQVSKELQFSPNSSMEDVKKAVAEMRESALIVNANEHSRAYIEARQEFNFIMNKVNAIITQFVKGGCNADSCSECDGGCK